ncbi:histone-like nucleoid-structuring protein, MvaT/MvaU family [Pseudomonas syringae]|uniref:histone-like nucleoid-structuring protein, MvaT/MvaU family n=1 Tax=Pseudomonas syringae TaxID=317 RepID=UPI0002098DFA|nr:histone-like nucleoid-structuring protein, MvaT/MvaU family [Pseudomonas syringae]MDP5168568.1 histone-like nucleoid-structuring protein, MvaT/MvaU family [Pseudomonas syringae pv. aptata str. DSM 50252]
MSKLAEFRKLEKDLADQLAALDALKGDAELQREIEFEHKLRELLGEYGFSLRNVIDLLDPAGATRVTSVANATGPKPTRRARQVKIYKNPHTGEMIETKGGNHKRLKEWKTEFGYETVEAWLQS